MSAMFSFAVVPRLNTRGGGRDRGQRVTACATLLRASLRGLNRSGGKGWGVLNSGFQPGEGTSPADMPLPSPLPAAGVQPGRSAPGETSGGGNLAQAGGSQDLGGCRAAAGGEPQGASMGRRPDRGRGGSALRVSGARRERRHRPGLREAVSLLPPTDSRLRKKPSCPKWERLEGAQPAGSPPVSLGQRGPHFCFKPVTWQKFIFSGA